METLAGQWWENVDVWAIVIAAFVALLIGWLGAWATFRSSNPKRKVNWWVASNTSLISPDLPTAGGELTVHLDGRKLLKPRIIELAIANEGRHAITSALFHGKAPVRFNFDGAGVNAILGVDTQPTGTVLPTFGIGPVTTVAQTTTAEDWVDLLPSLLSGRQVVTITVLVDGEEKDVKCVSAPLVDVEVVNQPRDVSALTNVVLNSVTLRVWPFHFDFTPKQP
ncbi:hypothetical protein [Streptomyces goshikiensis]